LILFSYKGSGFFTKKSNIFELQGIVSVALQATNSRACDPKKYAILTNVSPFTEWIRATAIAEWKYIEMEFEYDP